MLVTDDRDAAVAHGRRVLDAGGAVLVEEYLDGPEVSLFAVTDGTTVLPLVPAQDFKRRDDGDGGPNTGGMGAYAPLPWAPPGLVDEVLATVLQPTVDEMARRGETFSGLLYAGPGADLARACGWWSSTPASATPRPRSCCRCWRRRWPACCTPRPPARSPTHPPLRWRDGCRRHRRRRRVRVPGARRAPGDPITGADGEGVLHAGTALAADGTVVSAGGRVLAVTGRGRRPRRRPADRLRAGGRRPAGRRALAHRHRAGRRRGADRAVSEPDADEIWNRACDPFLPFTHPGDAALAAVLLCHGMAMNGGLLHAVQGLEPDQRERAADGFRLLGLDDAAAAVEAVARQAARLTDGDPAAEERLEVEAGRRYGEAVPDWDETIDRAFRAHLQRHPEAYAPLDP